MMESGVQRFMTRRFAVLAHILLGVCLVTMLPRAAQACSCYASGPPCQGAFSADSVFAATVAGIEEIPDTDPSTPPGSVRLGQPVRIVLKEVERYLGSGSVPGFVMTAGSGASCGYAFKSGERYLIYAHRDSAGNLVASICSRTRPIADADEDLRFLRGLPRTAGGPARVSGTALHAERDLGSGDVKEYGPVEGVFVLAQGPSGNASAWTDAKGRYELRLPPGKYEVSASPPAQYSSRYLRQPMELRDPRGCFVADFHLRFDGRVAGTLRSPGDAGGAALELIPVEAVTRSGLVETVKTTSEANGSFEFIEVPPGRYLLATGFSRPMDASVMFPTTYFPGTPDVNDARVIEVAGGERVRLEEMTLPPPRRPVRLTGQVLYSDGRPAAGVHVSLADGRTSRRQVAVGIATEADGTFSFTVHEGLEYVANASTWDAEIRRSLAVRSMPFTASAGMAPLRLVLAAGRDPRP